jgi:hypothetical protein
MSAKSRVGYKLIRIVLPVNGDQQEENRYREWHKMIKVETDSSREERNEAVSRTEK